MERRGAKAEADDRVRQLQEELCKFKFLCKT
jgi:hypothetical protein